MSTFPAPDVEAAHPALRSTRFNLTSDCPDRDCQLVVKASDAPSRSFPIYSLKVGGIANTEQLSLFIDSVTEPSPDASLVARRGFILSIASHIAAAYRVLMFPGGVAASIGLVIGFFRWRPIHTSPVLAALALASAAAVISRVFLLSYIDVTAFPTANTLYAAPASPFAILYVALGCLIGFRAIQGRFAITVHGEALPPSRA